MRTGSGYQVNALKHCPSRSSRIAARPILYAARSTLPSRSHGGGSVIVETFVTGRDYRCLVIDGRIAAIAERVPARVIGDGALTIDQLVAKINADPRRGVGHERC
jgi:D-alanine-D-alanine ligase-like ATP-grasp enzyme